MGHFDQYVNIYFPFTAWAINTHKKTPPLSTQNFFTWLLTKWGFTLYAVNFSHQWFSYPPLSVIQRSLGDLQSKISQHPKHPVQANIIKFLKITTVDIWFHEFQSRTLIIIMAASLCMSSLYSEQLRFCNISTNVNISTLPVGCTDMIHHQQVTIRTDLDAIGAASVSHTEARCQKF